MTEIFLHALETSTPTRNLCITSGCSSAPQVFSTLKGSTLCPPQRRGLMSEVERRGLNASHAGRARPTRPWRNCGKFSKRSFRTEMSQAYVLTDFTVKDSYSWAPPVSLTFAPSLICQHLFVMRFLQDRNSREKQTSDWTCCWLSPQPTSLEIWAWRRKRGQEKHTHTSSIGRLPPIASLRSLFRLFAVMYLLCTINCGSFVYAKQKMIIA